MRMIDADALRDKIIQRIIEEDTEFPEYDWGTGLSIAKDILERTPTVDAEPVRHGKWMKSTERNKEWWWFCSNCQEHYFEDDLYINEKHFPKYCPNCGAKMDAEQEKQNGNN